MGYIVPKAKTEAANFKKQDKHFLDEALAEIMQGTSKDAEGVVRSNAQRLAAMIFDSALYAETVKDRAIMAKLILERVGGKPSVIVDDEKEDLPEVVFRVNANDAKKIEALKKMDNLNTEEDNRVVVEIDGEPKMEF